MPRVWIIAALVPVLLITTWPAHQFAGHSHWQMVEWVPFSRLMSIRDVVANIALFMPLGFAIAWPGGRARIAIAVITGITLSLFAELYQVYCHDAFPTTADVLSNTLGTALGAVLARKRGNEPKIATKNTKHIVVR